MCASQCEYVCESVWVCVRVTECVWVCVQKVITAENSDEIFSIILKINKTQRKEEKKKIYPNIHLYFLDLSTCHLAVSYSAVFPFRIREANELNKKKEKNKK